MNEIVIDDKKYVSSKQAAQMTGYAKDYVGQLCREGRVPARLIGRNWYVLLSAIEDHRFGTIEPKKEIAVESVPEKTTEKWEAARYNAEPQAPHFPSINKLVAPKIEMKQEIKASAPEAPINEEEGGIALMHEAWKDWFSHATKNDEKEPVEPQEEVVESKEVSIPIQTVYVPQVIHDIKPQVSKELKLREVEEVVKVAVTSPYIDQVPQAGGSRALRTALSVVSILVFSVGVVGTGVLDSYISSLNTASVITGISSINK